MKALRRLDLPYLAAALVLLALVLYTGVFFLKSVQASYLFTLSGETVLRECETVQGVVLRCEEPVFGSGTGLIAEDGKRVGCGGLIAADARPNLPEDILGLTEMELELLRLRCLYSKQNICAMLSEPLSAPVRALAALPGIPEERAGLFDIEKMSKKLVSAYTELFESRFVTAPCAGLFSAYTDGYETLDASALPEARDYGRAVVGKLVTSADWFFEADTAACAAKVGERVTIELPGLSVQAQLVELSGGHARFKCTDNIGDVLRLRFEEAQLIYTEHSGFEVPRSAVSHDADGQAYVIAARGAEDEKIPIRLVHDSGDTCLVEAVDAGALREGAKIHRYALYE